MKRLVVFSSSNDCWISALNNVWWTTLRLCWLQYLSSCSWLCTKSFFCIDWLSSGPKNEQDNASYNCADWKESYRARYLQRRKYRRNEKVSIKFLTRFVQQYIFDIGFLDILIHLILIKKFVTFSKGDWVENKFKRLIRSLYRSRWKKLTLVLFLIINWQSFFPSESATFLLII